MKYIVLIGDGMADRPIEDIGGLTPLQKAYTPNMDLLASKGEIGAVKTIPDGLHPGSDVANLSILGYDPLRFYSGRAPLEAASMGISIKDNDVAYRCNLVCLKFLNKDRSRAVMEDYSAGHISSEEAKELIKILNQYLSTEKIMFYPGVSYRHLMAWRDGEVDVECTPPHDIIGKNIADYLPAGKGENILRRIMMKSIEILEDHEINKDRRREGKLPGNSIWLWGQGRKPEIPLFKDKYGLHGALISAVDLTKGLGVYAGFEILDVPGVTGYLDTNYEGKAEYCMNALNDMDLVYLHVEAPDEAGHSGRVDDKIKAIEDFDRLVVGKILKEIKGFQEYRILLLSDHATPVSVRTHTDEPVPFVIFDSTHRRENKGVHYDEFITERDDIVFFEEGYSLMEYFIKR